MLGIHRRFPELFRIHLSETLIALNNDALHYLRPILGSRRRSLFHFRRRLTLCFGGQCRLGGGILQHTSEQGVLLAVRVHILDALPLLETIERWLGDIDIAATNHLFEIAIKEREKQCPNMGPVDIGVRHNNDLVIPELRDIETLSDTGAERDDNRLERIRLHHFVKARLLDVHKLPSKRKNRLKHSISTLLGASTGGISLNDINLGTGSISTGAIGKLPGERHSIKRALSKYGILRRSSGDARPRRKETLLQNRLPVIGMRLQKIQKPLGNHARNDTAHIGISQLRLRLPLKLRIRQFHRDNRRKTFQDIFRREGAVFFFEKVLFLGVVIERPRERALESRHVRTTLRIDDIVCKRKEMFLERVNILNRNFNIHIAHRLLDIDRSRILDFLAAIQEFDERNNSGIK